MESPYLEIHIFIMKLPIILNGKITPIFVRANIELMKNLPTNLDNEERKALIKSRWKDYNRAEIDEDWKSISFYDQQSLSLFLMKYS